MINNGKILHARAGNTNLKWELKQFLMTSALSYTVTGSGEMDATRFDRSADCLIDRLIRSRQYTDSRLH